jgi:metallo-beta-lactamase class B
VFDNLYFIGTRIHSAWALTTSEGIIIIDTLFDYAVEPEIVEGLTMLGLRPRDVKYVLISHAHGDHDTSVHNVDARRSMSIERNDFSPSSSEIRPRCPALLAPAHC